MADTVITPSAYERDSGAAGWAVAVIILLAVVLFGIFVWPGIGRTPAGNASTPTPATPGTIDVNVQLPQGTQGGSQQGTPNTNPGTNNPAPAPAQ